MAGLRREAETIPPHPPEVPPIGPGSCVYSTPASFDIVGKGLTRAKSEHNSTCSGDGVPRN